MRQHDSSDTGGFGDAADDGRRHVELPRGAGLAFGNGVVRYEQICSLRQALEITVVSVRITREDDDSVAEAHTPGNCRHAAMDNLRGTQEEVATAGDGTDFIGCQSDIMHL